MIDFILDNYWVIVTTVFIMWKRNELYNRLFHDPMTGGNGVTQTHEFAQTTLIYTFIAFSTALLNGKEIDPQIFLYICGSVVILAGIKHHYKDIKIKDKNKSEDEEIH